MQNKKRSPRSKKIEKLFNDLEADIIIVDELLREHHGIDGKNDFSFVGKAALLRNLEAESRTRLAWTRTVLAVVGIVLGVALVFVLGS